MTQQAEDGRLTEPVVTVGQRRGLGVVEEARQERVERPLREHAQLGVYQVAVEHGGFTDGVPARSAGAALVHLGVPTVRPKQQHQSALVEADDPDWAMRLLARVSAGMAGREFPAVVNDLCGRCSLRGCCPATGDGRPVTL